MNVTHTKTGWEIDARPATLTDEAAMAITFVADADQVVLGQLVEVIDAEGTRIGHLQTATYRERLNMPPYVVVGINLR